MGRKKLEMKRIEDKNSRHVSFSKRKTGLFKKARHLSALCDVDIAVIIISSYGKLYEACSGTTSSVGSILSRYHSCLEAKETSIQECSSNDTCTRFRTCKDLLQLVERVDEDPYELPVSDMTELEKELNHALMYTRSKKTELLMERISTLHKKERELAEETEEMKHQIASARPRNNDEVDAGGGGPNNLATDEANSPPRLTLSLF